MGCLRLLHVCCNPLNHLPSNAPSHVAHRRFRESRTSLMSESSAQSSAVQGFYAGLNVCALVMIFFLVPESKKRTLEELDYVSYLFRCALFELSELTFVPRRLVQVFAVPTGKHASYQLNKALPYFFKRYIFRRKVHLEPLYDFDEVDRDEKKGVTHVHSDLERKRALT